MKARIIRAGEGGGGDKVGGLVTRCPLPTRRPSVGRRAVAHRADTPAFPRFPPSPLQCGANAQAKKKKEPPRHKTKLHDHIRPATLATQKKEQGTAIPHPRPTQATPTPSTPAHSCGTAAWHNPRSPAQVAARGPTAPAKGSPATAGHTAIPSAGVRSTACKEDPGAPHGSVVRPTAAQLSDLTPLRPPARSPMSARPPIPVTAQPQPGVHRAQKEHTALTAGRRR